MPGHVINCKLTSCLASYLRSGDHIRWVVEKIKCNYKVIVSVGYEVFIFKFNCSSGKCSVTIQNLPSEIPLNFLGFINNYPACRPAACKKFLQSQLWSFLSSFWHSFSDVFRFFTEIICGKNWGGSVTGGSFFRLWAIHSCVIKAGAFLYFTGPVRIRTSWQWTGNNFLWFPRRPCSWSRFLPRPNLNSLEANLRRILIQSSLHFPSPWRGAIQKGTDSKSD